MNKKTLTQKYKLEAPGVTGVHEDISLSDFIKSPQTKVLHHVLRIMNCGYLALKYSGAMDKAGQIRILDIGAGNGEILNILRGLMVHKGCILEYTAMDLDERKKEQYHKMHPRTRHPYIIHDIRKKLPQDSNSVEAIIATEVIEHITEIDGVNLIGEMYRILVPNGILVLTTPDTKNYRGSSPYHIHEWESSKLKSILQTKLKILKQFWYLVPWHDLELDITRNYIKEIMDPEWIRTVLSPVSGNDTGGIVCFVCRKDF